MSLSSVRAAASCPSNSVAHWQQSFSCGYAQQPNTVFAHIGYTLGYWALPALAVVAVLLILVSVARRKSPRFASR